MRLFCQIITLTGLLPCISIAGEWPLPTIAIIIDDMGNHQQIGAELATLPFPLTLSFLPHRKHTQTLAKLAHEHQKGIMLHMPMANTKGLRLGPGALQGGMTQVNFTRTLRTAIQSVPHLQGLNNHMGSQLTQQTLEMNWLMTTLQHYPLYFVDSRTIASTIAAKVAQQHGIPTLSRDVFLDHQISKHHIQLMFERLLSLARKNDYAIAIGHPHPETLAVLKEQLPLLGEKGFAIATINGLWELANPGKKMYANRPAPETQAQFDSLGKAALRFGKDAGNHTQSTANSSLKSASAKHLNAPESQPYPTWEEIIARKSTPRPK
ncbi:divergent polysaccharide deacetylase family protein [Oleiphilus messinensis]|nr:divergent polysaccharide deacetylase family protein [Oleiphilus messinensis]